MVARNTQREGWFAKLGVLSWYPKQVQKFAEWTEKTQHQVMHYAAITKHFKQVLPERLEKAVIDRKISREVADRAKNVRSQAELDRKIWRDVEGLEVDLQDDLQLQMLEPDDAELWRAYQQAQYPDGMGTGVYGEMAARDIAKRSCR
jgi:hypothetical protein